MGDSLGDVAHVERGEGRWLRDCAVELVLALLDERLEVFEDVEIVFSGGLDGLVELLLLRGDGRAWRRRRRRRGTRGSAGSSENRTRKEVSGSSVAFAVVEVDASPSHSFHPATRRWDSSWPSSTRQRRIFPSTLVAPLVSYFRLSCLRAHHPARYQTDGCSVVIYLPGESIHTPTVTAWAPVFTPFLLSSVTC